MFEDLGIDPSFFDGASLFRGRGCDRCKHTGYSGRLPIIEAMSVTDDIRRLVLQRASAHEISKVAIALGMTPLRMVALEKAREGTSTLEQTLIITAGY